jgi:hypothetical protein
MNSRDFYNAIEKYNTSNEVSDFKGVEVFSFRFKAQTLGIKVFEVTIGGETMYDYSVSHYLLIEGNHAPYKHTSGPRLSPKEALEEALITLFQLLQGNENSYKWVKNKRYEEI